MATAILFTIPSWGQAQKEPVLDLSIPQNYRIGGITVLGAEYTDVQAVKLFSALQIGANITIPGDDIGRAIKNLWDQDLFADIFWIFLQPNILHVLFHHHLRLKYSRNYSFFDFFKLNLKHEYSSKY